MTCLCCVTLPAASVCGYKVVSRNNPFFQFVALWHFYVLRASICSWNPNLDNKSSAQPVFVPWANNDTDKWILNITRPDQGELTSSVVAITMQYKLSRYLATIFKKYSLHTLPEISICGERERKKMLFDCCYLQGWRCKKGLWDWNWEPKRHPHWEQFVAPSCAVAHRKWYLSTHRVFLLSLSIGASEWLIWQFLIVGFCRGYDYWL